MTSIISKKDPNATTKIMNFAKAKLDWQKFDFEHQASETKLKKAETKAVISNLAKIRNLEKDDSLTYIIKNSNSGEIFKKAEQIHVI